MLEGLLTSLCALAVAAPTQAVATPDRSTVAVVVTGREGLYTAEGLQLAQRLARALTVAGASVPLDPQATVAKLEGRDPAACGSRSPCLAALARALHVSGLVTVEGGKVVDQFALVVGLVDGRDGRKLLERSSAATSANLDSVLASLAGELASVARALPGPSALDAHLRPRPDLEPRRIPGQHPGLNFSAPAVASSAGAVAAGGVAAGFLVAALAEWVDLRMHTRQVTVPGEPSGRTASDYTRERTDMMATEINRRLTISLVAGIGAAALAGTAGYFLLQPPQPAPPPAGR